MALALDLSEDFPLQDLFWTMLILTGWALFFYTLVLVFRDLFGRDDVSAWGKAAWVLLVLVVPLIGALAYLASQSAEMGQRELRRKGATDLRMDAYTRSVTGDGAYHGLHDEATFRRDMSGPVRPA